MKRIVTGIFMSLIIIGSAMNLAVASNYESTLRVGSDQNPTPAMISRAPVLMLSSPSLML